MQNLIDKYASEAVEATDEDGVVAIEYVIVSAALVTALALLWTAFGGQLSAKMQEIIDGITV